MLILSIFGTVVCPKPASRGYLSSGFTLDLRPSFPAQPARRAHAGLIGSQRSISPNGIPSESSCLSCCFATFQDHKPDLE
ncbi:hypothetical protein SK128_024879 [Halocaridina rubra]|uniref:Uncharacterized protein n=1 Tax=Halocaridina rubra TaxID=373956 RepID=A0AAN8WXC1_HALRR